MGSDVDMTPKTPSEQFAAWLEPAMRAAGYDLDRLSGGRVAFAEAVAVSPGTVTRWLQGKSTPDPSKFEAIATALKVDPIEMLVEIGVLSAKTLTPNPSTEVDFRPTTPSRAADELGITDPRDRALFFALVDQLNQGPRKLPDTEQGDEAAHG